MFSQGTEVFGKHRLVPLILSFVIKQLLYHGLALEGVHIPKCQPLLAKGFRSAPNKVLQNLYLNLSYFEIKCAHIWFLKERGFQC